MNYGNFETKKWQDATELLAAPVRALLEQLQSANVLVAPIDPSFSDTAAFCTEYGVTPAQCANCVIVEGKGGETNIFAACMVLGSMRLDVNIAVRTALAVKKVSFAKMEDAVSKSAMEYGAITPVGLPSEWPILVDAAVAQSEWVVIGSGVRNSKLIVPGSFFGTLPNTRIIDALAKPRETTPI